MSDEAATGLRNNTVTLENQGDITGVSYVSGSLVITNNQPSNPPPKIEQSSGKFKITLEAGRKSSTDVAASFNAACGGPGKAYAPVGGAKGLPEALNFYFAVTLTIRGASVTVYLGQGSISPINNWWIGGSAIYNNGSASYLQYQSGGTTISLGLSGNNDTLVFDGL